MGIIDFLFGGGIKKIGDGIEQVGGVFRPNAEAADKRGHEVDVATLDQYAAEFHARANRTRFDSFVDGLNRLVRPVITLSVLSVIPATIMWPNNLAIAFAALALLPAGYWALVGVITSFYFGGRMQIKSHDFAKSINESVARAPAVISNMERLRSHLTPREADGDDIDDDSENKALDDWLKIS